jgi:hypothetical protein
MEITVIFLILAAFGLMIWIGVKGTKNSKNKPPQIR